MRAPCTEAAIRRSLRTLRLALYFVFHVASASHAAMMWSQWRDKLKELTEEALDGEGGGEVDAVQVPFWEGRINESGLHKQLELEEATRAIERINGQLATKTQEVENDADIRLTEPLGIGCDSQL